jgi:LacI family transcriptional regulator
LGIITDTITAQRLAPGLFRALAEAWETRFLDVDRPVQELRARAAEWRADVLVARWLPGLVEELRPLGPPLVLIGGHERAVGVCCLGVDNPQVGEQAAEHLLERGYPHLAFVGKDAPYSHLRHEGFARALARRGRPPASSHILPDEGRERYLEDWMPPDTSLLAWLAALPRPAGVFAAQDSIGRRVLQACARLGLRVPEDVAVVAANNDELACGLARPGLSSVRIPWDGIGAEVARAAERLHAAGVTPEAPLQAVRVAPAGVVARGSSDAFLAPEPALAKALRHLHEHCGEALDVDGLARAAGLSRRRMEELFQRAGRDTPKREITRARMQRARELLACTDLDLGRVAEACGYAYAARFSTAFREATGCTPSEFRRRRGALGAS